MATEEQDAWIGRVLGVTMGGEGEGDDAGELDLVELGLLPADLWEGARDSFQNAVEEVDAQIAELQSALRESDDPELHEIAELGLNALTGNTRVPLMAAMQEAGNGAPERMKVAAPKLQKAIDAFRAQLGAEPRIAACDENPFGVTVAIRDTYESALHNLEQAVKQAA